MAPSFAVGKLPTARLRAMLSQLRHQDSRLVVGPRVGEDAAVLDMGYRYLVVTTDPITFATDRAGWYAVHVNANDIAVMGARPRWFFVVLLLPEQLATESLVETIMGDLGDACHTLGITVSGGHTEITARLERPIVVGQMLGEVDKGRLVHKGALAAGDVVLLTQGVAIEGTSLLAREKRETLRQRIPEPQLTTAEGYLFEPGISVVEAALAAVDAGEVHAMHDPTEGGVVTGLYELATASALGLHVYADEIPILPETRVLCEALDIDPLRLIASGALLIGTSPSQAPHIATALRAIGVPVTTIGEVRPPGDGLVIESDGKATPLEPAARDEIARVL